MNKSGIVFLYRLSLATCIIILGIAFANPIREVIAPSMADLVCTAPANDFDQAACWALDIIKPLFIGMTIFIGFLVLTKL